jgi:hypothetical protein
MLNLWKKIWLYLIVSWTTRKLLYIYPIILYVQSKYEKFQENSNFQWMKIKLIQLSENEMIFQK